MKFKLHLVIFVIRLENDKMINNDYIEGKKQYSKLEIRNRRVCLFFKKYL